MPTVVPRPNSALPNPAQNPVAPNGAHMVRAMPTTAPTIFSRVLKNPPPPKGRMMNSSSSPSARCRQAQNSRGILIPLSQSTPPPRSMRGTRARSQTAPTARSRLIRAGTRPVHRLCGARQLGMALTRAKPGRAGSTGATTAGTRLGRSDSGTPVSPELAAQIRTLPPVFAHAAAVVLDMQND